MQLVYLSLLLTYKILFILLNLLKLSLILIDAWSFLAQHSQGVGFNVEEDSPALIDGILYADHLMVLSKVVLHTNITYSFLHCLHEIGDLFIKVSATWICNVWDSSRIVFIEVDVLDGLRACSFSSSSFDLGFMASWADLRGATLVSVDALKVRHLLVEREKLLLC